MTDFAANTYVVIPAFNESKVIRNTLLSLVGRYQIVVVDDASTDETFRVLSGLPVHYLRHPVNMGQGAALQTGMDYAREQGASFVVHFDADGQHNASDIPRFLAKLVEGDYDVIIGSRFLRNDDRLHVPFLKQVILKTATIINGLLTGLWLTDAHNGFRVMNRKALSCIRLRENRMAHATEILTQIRRQNLHMTELDTKIVYTDYSKQKGQSWTNSFNILLDLIISRYFR